MHIYVISVQRNIIPPCVETWVPDTEGSIIQTFRLESRRSAKQSLPTVTLYILHLQTKLLLRSISTMYNIASSSQAPTSLDPTTFIHSRTHCNNNVTTSFLSVYQIIIRRRCRVQLFWLLLPLQLYTTGTNSAKRSTITEPLTFFSNTAAARRASSARRLAVHGDRILLRWASLAITYYNNYNYWLPIYLSPPWLLLLYI